MTKEQDKKYTDYDVHMSDYDAACDYQYCGKWNDTFAEKSGGRLIWKQLWSVCRSRWYAIKEVERRAEIFDIGIMCTEGILKGNENGGFVSADETVRKMLPYNQEYVLKEGTYPERRRKLPQDALSLMQWDTMT